MLVNGGKPAELIAALWVIGRNNASENIPNYRGILDRALQSIKDQLPAGVKDKLDFSNTSVGLRCLQLPQIIDDMQYMMLADISMTTSIDVNADEQQAYSMLYEQGIGRLEADDLAHRFYQLVKKESE